MRELKELMKSVLIAEDNTDLREIFAQVFTFHDFNVRVAHDGQAALACLEAELPDVLVLDINMPRLSGFDVLAFIRRRTSIKQVKIIVVTGSMLAMQSPEAEYADLFLVKPVAVHDLIEFATRLIAQ